MTERRVAVVTGATSGIGRWIALGLVKAGLHAVLVARDPQRGAIARDWIAGEAPGAETELALANMTSLSAVRRVGEEIAERHPRIAILVNNAGTITDRRRLTAEGRETTFAVNYLAPFVLTRALEPALRAGAPSRIVNIGSAASDRARLNLDDLEGQRSWRRMRAYGQSKLALMIATFEWARRLEGSGVTANVVHPGMVATGIGDQPGLSGLGWRMLKPFLIGPEKGADTPLHVALAPELEGVSGRYFKRRAEARPNALALDPRIAARLWAETEKLIAA